MPTLFVAASRALQAWASDVGLTQHVYKIGVSSAEDGAAAIEALNAAAYAGRTDWDLIAEEQVADTEEEAIIARTGRKETMVDPLYYPQIKKARGIFKVKPANVENHFMVREALEGQQIKRIKLTPERIGAYLLRAAAG
jgi:hypothetical protein